MKFCEPHWSALRAAIDTRGLSQFIAKGGAEAARRMEAEIKGATTGSTFEPLMSAHWRIVQVLTEIGGAEVLIQDGCPICFGNEKHRAGCKDPGCTYSYDLFIDKAADEALLQARHLGLVDVQ